jgi:predicted dinucleotide-binding enzyme
MRIAIIGVGHVGTALGERWRAHGHEVKYGVRPGRSHPSGSATSIAEAVAASECVVLAIPWHAAASAVAELGDLGGRVLVDATNPIGPGMKLAIGHTTSAGETLQALAKHARVVKAFNSVGFEVMLAPHFDAGPAMMLVAGDDAEATAAVAGLAHDLGFDGIPLLGLARARELEPLAMLWIELSRRHEWGRRFAFGLRRRKGIAKPVTRRASKRHTIAIYGAGNIGGNLARAWLRAGHEVRLAVRDAGSDDVRALVAAGARAVPLANAAANAEAVALAVPAGAVGDIVAQAGDLDGKLVIDCTNAIGRGLGLQYGLSTSAAEQLQARIPGARVVKAFNQQGAETLAAPIFDNLATLGFVAGDDAGARALAASLVQDVGLAAVDVGPLSMARYLEPLTLLWVAASQSLGTRELGLVRLQR